jgi:hypothetical protein
MLYSSPFLSLMTTTESTRPIKPNVIANAGSGNPGGVRSAPPRLPNRRTYPDTIAIQLKINSVQAFIVARALKTGGIFYLLRGFI